MIRGGVKIVQIKVNAEIFAVVWDILQIEKYWSYCDKQWHF